MGLPRAALLTLSATLWVAPLRAQGAPEPSSTAADEALQGSAKVSGTVVSFSAETGTLRLRDRMGGVSDFSVDARTLIRAGKAPVGVDALRPGAQVRLLRYERRGRHVLRIDLRGR